MGIGRTVSQLVWHRVCVGPQHTRWLCLRWAVGGGVGGGAPRCLWGRQTQQWCVRCKQLLARNTSVKGKTMFAPAQLTGTQAAGITYTLCNRLVRLRDNRLRVVWPTTKDTKATVLRVC